MSFFSFGKHIEGKSFKVLDERNLRANGGLMFLLGLIAFNHVFFRHNYEVVMYVSGFLMLNFIIGIFINPKFAPTMFLGWLFVRKQTPIYIGAIQKRFAWSLGLTLVTTIFILSIFLQSDVSYFEPVCLLCLVCLILLFVEVAFGICIGCKLYYLAIYLKLFKAPEEKPNCMGDACEV